MLLTLGLTGMDQATETALKTSFSDANERLGFWQLQSEAEADYVIVDMDSMYGPMSWLRLHAAGKRVLGLTTAPRTQADYRLARPFSSATLNELLTQIAGERGVELPTLSSSLSSQSAAPVSAPAQPPAEQRSATPPAPAVAPIMVPPPVAAASAAPTTPPTPIPASTSTPPSAAFARPAATTTSASPSSYVPPPPVAATTAPLAATAPVADREPSSARGTSFADWLRPGALSGRARYSSGKGPALLIDFVHRQYFGPATLKPLAEYFVETVSLRDFEQLDEPSWQAAVVASGGEPQSLSRLQWYGALLAGEGRLLAGFNVDGKFSLSKWPQTEREYPRHFRIATAMMKGPMTIGEIATASGVPAADVIDFINANLTTGFAEPAGIEGDAAKGSLLGKLRGR